MTFFFSGDQILVDLSDSSKEEATMDIYNIEVTETLELEEDEAAGCKEYEKSIYGNYGNCIVSQIEATFLPILGCKPPWFHNGVERQNNQQIPICESMLQHYNYQLKDAMEVMDMTSFEVSFLQKSLRFELLSFFLRLATCHVREPT